MSAATHNRHRYIRSVRGIIKFMQVNDLPGQLEHSADAFLRIEAGMSRASLDFNREHSRSLPCRFRTAAACAGLQHQNRAGVLSFSFNQGAAAWAAALFIASQQNGNRTPWPRGRGFASAQQFERERAVRFHVKNSWAIDPIAFGSPRALFN